MPKDRQSVDIDIAGKQYTIDAPAGLSDQQIIASAVASDPEFADAYASHQAQRTAGQESRPMMTYEAEHGIYTPQFKEALKKQGGDIVDTATAIPIGGVIPEALSKFPIAKLAAEQAIKRVPSAMVGAAGGRYAGEKIGQPVAGEVAGGIVGMAAPELVGRMAEGAGKLYRQFSGTPEPVPLPTIARAEMEKDIQKGQLQRAAARAQMEKDLAKRAAKTEELPAIDYARNRTLNERSLSGGASGGSMSDYGVAPIHTPEPTFKRNMKIAAAQNPPVIVAPEPRPPFSGENPSYMASISRKELPGLAQAGKPGAGEQLQNLGTTVIYAPPTGYPGPRIAPPSAMRSIIAAPEGVPIRQETNSIIAGPDQYPGPRIAAPEEEEEELPPISDRAAD